MTNVVPFTWPAKFPGVCEDCGERFLIGTKIRWIDPEEHTVAHAQCPDDDGVELPRGRKEDACPDCQLIHRGDCY